LSGFTGAENEGLTKFEIGIGQIELKIGVLKNILIGKRAVSTDRDPGEDLGGKHNRGITIVSDGIGLGNGDTGTDDKFGLGWFENEIKVGHISIWGRR
jgi:hypothetical protein